MGMLEGKIVGEVMAIQIAEIGAQGAQCTFTVLSRDESGQVSTCRGTYGYVYETLVVEGDVRNGDLEKALPIIKETGVVQPCSFVRGHFKSKDGQWLHLDTGCGNHFFVNDKIAKAFLDSFKGRGPYDVYCEGVSVAKGLMGTQG